jgi:hypothetical protein
VSPTAFANPTGFAKICGGYACIFGNQYVSQDNTRIIKIDDNPSGSSIGIKTWLNNGECYNSFTGTIQTSTNQITFSLFSVNYTITSNENNNFSGNISVSDGTSTKIYRLDASTIPTKMCCSTVPLENCVKGKEFVNISNGLTIRFNPTNLTLTVFTTAISENFCFMNRPYTVDALNRQITCNYMRNVNMRQEHVIKFITDDSFYMDRNIRNITRNTIERTYNNLYFVIKTSLPTLTCSPQAGAPFSYVGTSTSQFTLEGLKFQGIPDPAPNKIDVITIIFSSEGSDLFLHTPSKGCKQYGYTLRSDGISIEFLEYETLVTSTQTAGIVNPGIVMGIGFGGTSEPEQTIQVWEVSKYIISNFTTNGCDIINILETFNSQKTTRISSTTSLVTNLLTFNGDFDTSMCKGKTCPPDQFKYCEGSTYNQETELCSDGRTTTCFSTCSNPNDVCPSPFTTTMKFMNEDDYSDRITITSSSVVFNDSEPYKYFVVSLSNQKVIVTPVSTFIYEVTTTDWGNKIHSLKTFESKHIVYKDLRSYFYKKTFIKPVDWSFKNVDRKTKNCITNTETTDTIQESILYHCITFENFESYRYTVLKKSQVVAFHDDNSTNATYFEHLIDPVGTDTPYSYGRWNVDTENELLSHSGISGVGSILLEEYESTDMTLFNLIISSIGNDGWGGYESIDTYYTQKNLVCYDPGRSILSSLRKIGLNSNDYMVIEFPNNEIRPDGIHRILQLTRKDTDQKVIVEIVAFDTTDLSESEKTQSNTWRRAIVNILDINGNVVPRTNFPFYENLFNDKRTSIRVSYMRRRNINQESPSSLIIDRETGNIGNFIRYDCQLLSGVEGYNRCSTKLINLQSVYRPEYYEDIADAANKCDATESCIGFEYDTSNKTAIFLRHYELRSTNTNRNEIVTTSRSDLSDTLISVYHELEPRFNYWSEAARTTYIQSRTLFHNIFPCDKVSPITDTQELSPKTVTTNESVTGILQSPVMTQSGANAPQITFNNTTTNTKIVYLKSNIPNIFGKTFIGIHHKKRLPKTYSGNIGKKSIPREITAINTLTIDGIQQSNKLLKIYRVTQNTENDIFFITIDDRYIKNDFTTSDSLEGQEFLWNIVSFDGYENKLFLVSVLDKDIVLEIDLQTNFVFPIAFVENIPLLLELNDNNDSCVMSIDGTRYNCYYLYTGNDLVFYDKVCNSDGTESFQIVRRFRFYGTDCELYDLASGLKLQPTQSTRRGSFISTRNISSAYIPGRDYALEADRFITSAWAPVALFQENPILGILNLSVMGGALPPAVIGDMNAKENGIWFGMFFASFVPVGRVLGPVLRTIRLPAIALRFPKIGFNFRLPRIRTGGRIPETPIRSGRVDIPPEGPIMQADNIIVPATDDIVRTMPKIPSTPIGSMPKIPPTPVGGSVTPASARPAAGVTGGRVPTARDASKFAKQVEQTSDTTLLQKPRPDPGSTATGNEYAVQYGSMYGRGFNPRTGQGLTEQERRIATTQELARQGFVNPIT